MGSILYLTFNILGFISLFFSILFFNKKYKVLPFEHLFYYYILFVISFLIFAKIFYIILSSNYNFSINYSLIRLIKFIFSGYTFIGGLIGGFSSIFLLAKVTKKNFNDILLLFLPSMLLMYSIMKVGCYFAGCCKGINGFNIQLVESFSNMFGYIFIVICLKNRENKLYFSGLIFGVLRFIISFFRDYSNMFSFLFALTFCFLLMIISLYGLIINKKKGKLCKKG